MEKNRHLIDLKEYGLNGYYLDSLDKSVSFTLLMRIFSVIEENPGIDAITFDCYKIGTYKQYVPVFANKYSLTCLDTIFGSVVCKKEYLDSMGARFALLNVLVKGGQIKEVHEPVGSVKEEPLVSYEMVVSRLSGYIEKLFGKDFIYLEETGSLKCVKEFNEKVACIIISSNSDLLKNAIDSIICKGIDNIEIHVAWFGEESNSTDFLYSERYREYVTKVRYIQLSGGFNFSTINNMMFEDIRRSKEYEYVLLMNDDIQILDKDFLKNMIWISKNEPEVSVVGAQLLYPDKTIQHAGIRLGNETTLFEHIGKGEKYDHYRYPTREVSAVTFALVLISVNVYDHYMLDEKYPSDCNDIDFCFRIKQDELSVWCVGGAVAIHLESATRKNDSSVKNDDSRKFFEENYDELQERFVK